MLAYDIYLKNKDYQYEFTGSIPIKKIFVSTGISKDLIIKIDNTSLQQYGINENDTNRFQSVFQMPEKNKAQLPYKSTGTNSQKPYLELDGKFESRKNISKFTINFIGKKIGVADKSKFTAELEIDENKQKTKTNKAANKYVENIVAKGSLQVRLNKTEYCLENNIPIYDLYDKHKLIKKDSLHSLVFHKISIKFFNFIKNKWIDELSNAEQKSSLIRFSIVILPTSKKIIFKPKMVEDVKKVKELRIMDSFGNGSFGFPQESTQTAKFLSFDDPAFSVNCKSKSEFYQNLSIGKQSFEKINIPNDSVMNISGLSWIFADLDDPSYKFEQVKRGIFHQLLLNYRKFKEKSGDSLQKQSTIKIICFEKNQAKLEILLDDNLTMQKMRRMFQTFSTIDPFKSNIPINALEILIDKSSGTKVIWSLYMNAVQSFLHERKMERHLLMSFFNKAIRAKIFEWINSYYNNSEITEFFSKSEFCIKILTTSGIDISIMNSNEEYAYKIGLIAGRYITFKKHSNEQSNTLRDILTYTKYDREKLRFVFNRIGLGINLSNADESNEKNMLDFIKQNNLSNEISDADANLDYSYFFYKGVFRELC